MARNDGAFGNRVWTPEEVINAASAAYEEFSIVGRISKHIQSNHIHSRNLSVPIWKPPAHPFLKLNCDASAKTKCLNKGVGFIIRMPDGNPIFAKSEVTQFSDITEGEALAIRSGLLEALAMGVEFLEVESDSKGVVELILNPGRLGSLEVQPII
ncbi:uncharacterized protein LOC122650778 [Telopea speciosissima]|uniref:uncharacterized protein LOC122650778 n=1 Tax=Telopea speciosissima TaxID=54955 RepID=UPI001CC6E8FB|nr:uncharacterized protein LOC122650778 [Telopea speciosissima]